jgi:hypothetical protein
MKPFLQYFFFFFGQKSFPGMVGPSDKAPICLSFEEVTVRTGYKVFLKVDDNSPLKVGSSQGI